ncbi:heterokaryon incompatibility protein-domain-containing protein, partial [Cladorrhinum sp. PSN259]
MDTATQQGPAASWAYRDLKSQREMRLLVVQPGSFDDFIRCRLVHVKTDTLLEYEAISYTWADETGDATKTKTILLGNSPFLVTANCEAALKRIRKDSVTRTVWIDAVCINQDNKNEQGHQVQLMPDIYSRATRVLIYLGDPLNEESEGLMRLDNTRATVGSLPTPEEDPELAASVLRSVKKAVSSLCGRRYFSRVWILQEVALARAAIVICGKYEVPWRWFRNHAKSLASDPYFSESPLPKAVTLEPRKHRDKSDLMNLLDDARNCHATDPRDKVFAVFGLIQCPTTLGLVPNYNATVEEVYTDAALQIASLHGIENLLIRACDQRNYESLPTWVPDWS